MWRSEYLSLEEKWRGIWEQRRQETAMADEEAMREHEEFRSEVVSLQERWKSFLAQRGSEKQAEYEEALREIWERMSSALPTLSEYSASYSSTMDLSTAILRGGDVGVAEESLQPMAQHDEQGMREAELRAAVLAAERQAREV